MEYLKFIEIPATRMSLGKRSEICGVGINDSNYLTEMIINGKHVKCPFYSRWVDMIKRCYSKNSLRVRPTYNGCSVCKEWFIFSNFKSWMIKQDWKGKELDKDILSQGNKVYSPETCIFVSQEINKLITTSKAKRGIYPQGVSFEKSSGRFTSTCRINGRSKKIGRFKSPKEAYEKYIEFKSKLILDIANKQDEPLKTALVNISINYSSICEEKG